MMDAGKCELLNFVEEIPKRTPFRLFALVFLLCCDIELDQHAEFRLGNICADAVSSVPVATGRVTAVPVISSGKIDSRTSLSSCWSSTPMVNSGLVVLLSRRGRRGHAN